jgi:hypothetical protein
MSKDDAAIPSAARQTQHRGVLYSSSAATMISNTVVAAAAAAPSSTTTPKTTTATAESTTSLTSSFFPGGISEVSFDGGDHPPPVAAAAASVAPCPFMPTPRCHETNRTTTTTRQQQVQPTTTSTRPPQRFGGDVQSHGVVLPPTTPRIVTAEHEHPGMNGTIIGTTHGKSPQKTNHPPLHHQEDIDDEEEGTTTPKDDDNNLLAEDEIQHRQQLQLQQSLTSPIGTVHADYFLHSESVASDLSSSSADNNAAGGGREDGDPTTTTLSPSHHHHHHHHVVPPAPPSTPASSHAGLLSMSFDSGMMLETIGGPPTFGSLTGADSYLDTTRTLEEQQQRFLAAAEAMTPLPPRRSSSSSNIGDAPMTPVGGTTNDDDDNNDVASAPKLPTTDDFSDWAVGDRYELIRILGRGSYGEVAQAIDTQAHPQQQQHKQQRDDEEGRDTEDNNEDDEGDEEITYVAIKRIQSPFDQQVDAVRLYREIHILRQMQAGQPHECLIQLLDVVQPPTDDLDDFHDLYLVFECTYILDCHDGYNMNSYQSDIHSTVAKIKTPPNPQTLTRTCTSSSCRPST